MAQRLVLHVGLMKSGTSYLQRRLLANRDLLAGRGVLFPGDSWRDQVLAVSDVLGRQQAGPAAAGRWAWLQEQVATYDGTVVVSMEFLGPARPERVAAVVSSFGETPVEVLVTLRDLGRAVPAMWQESLQNGGSFAWETYVGLLAGRRKPAQAFWRQQGMARIVGNWTEAVGADRVTLVTVPRPGAEPGALWERFCAAAGIPGEGCVELDRVNTSLDAASALVLLELNQRLVEDDLSPADYHAVVKFGLAKGVLSARTGGAPIGFEPPRWLVERSAEIVARLAASGARVVGTLEDLDPVPVCGVDPGSVPEAERLDAAVDVIRALTLRATAARRRGRAQPTATSDTS